jgi:hypothetical protein
VYEKFRKKEGIVPRKQTYSCYYGIQD